jgi:hypothetical protein
LFNFVSLPSVATATATATATVDAAKAAVAQNFRDGLRRIQYVIMSFFELKIEYFQTLLVSARISLNFLFHHFMATFTSTPAVITKQS